MPKNQRINKELEQEGERIALKADPRTQDGSKDVLRYVYGRSWKDQFIRRTRGGAVTLRPLIWPDPEDCDKLTIKQRREILRFVREVYRPRKKRVKVDRSKRVGT